ncbi:MAG: AAA family ATPase [Ktedonobacteraceae bacterium]|nr:AAA family ATPase [Ktedonobacteraceae bacterium]
MADIGLTKIRFKHFKAFDESVEVDLAPITVIAGVNSGGKSTIIQSLLLARQTLITPYRQSVENALEYDGELVRFGSFLEMIFGNPAASDAGMWLEFTVHTIAVPPNNLLKSTPKYWAVIKGDERVSMRVDVAIQFIYDDSEKVVAPHEVVLSAYYQPDGHDYPDIILRLRPNKNSANFLLTLNNQPLTISEDEIDFDRFIPVWKWIDVSGNEEYVALYYTFRTLFEPALALLRTELTEHLFYIGPLRSAPQRSYLRRNIVGLDVGATGEYAVQQLHEHWSDTVTFVAVPNDRKELHPEQLTPLMMPLSEAVSAALRLMGMYQQLRIEKLGESYEASLSLLSDPQKSVFITEVGFGVSQILPIIALGLLSPINSILIFEQPEIHLHPRAQAGLAEFVLCLARTGRLILVETHSDHLINRLRRRAAEDETDTLGAMVNILFVTPPTADGEGAKIERGRINQYGDIENWPPGFLADAAQDARAIMLAGSNKRLREQHREQAG